MGNIENSHFRISTAAGNKGFVIDSLMDIRNQKEWIYSEEGIKNKRNSMLSYDEQYCGGMEVLFPGDEKELYEGILYEDHGMLWRMNFCEEESENRIKAEGYDEKNKIQACFRLELSEEIISLDIEITNCSEQEIPYLIRLHPAFAVSENSELECNIDNIIFEKEYRYCSFTPVWQESVNGKIVTEEKETVELERPETWEKHDIFCHVTQNKGEFAIKEENKKLIFRYEHEKLPYLTVCSFMRNGKRIWIPEPANVPGINLSSAEAGEKAPRLMPEETITYRFEIIPE